MSGEDVRRDNTVGEEIEMDGGGELRIEVVDPLLVDQTTSGNGTAEESVREGGKPLSHWFSVANAPDSTRRCFSFAVVNRLVLGRRLVLDPPLIASYSTTPLTLKTN